jgi:hypothetical protein
VGEELNQKPNTDIVMYTTDDGLTKIEATFNEGTVWLSLDQMADLFQKNKSTISRHIKNIFTEGEVQYEATVAKYATVQHEGDRQVERQIDYYNLDVIISVGYRVKSQRGVQFRRWAAARLKEYIIKGFTLDDERLKGNGGGNYWKELLNRIRDIRSSEKVLYRQVLDLYGLVWIMTRIVMNLSGSLKLFRTSCILLPMGILRQRSYLIGRMLKSHLWD